MPRTSCGCCAPLRLRRARLDYRIDEATAGAIHCQAAEIGQVSQERIRDELTRILTEGGARRGCELLYSLGLLARVLPEAVRLRGVAQPPLSHHHPEGDVWVHTMLLLEKLPPGSSPTLAWGALLHDIGKPATYQPPNPAIAGDRIRFNGHVEVGVRIAEEVLARLRFSNEDTAQIVALVKNHMRFGDVREMRESTLKRFLRLPHFEEHLELHRMDAGSAHGDLSLYDFARAHYEAEPAEEHRPSPLVTGADLIAAGYRPSPQFKAMLTLAEDAQLEGAATTREEALALAGTGALSATPGRPEAGCMTWLPGRPWQLRRIISTGTWIPQIDGLRFIAILPVVLFHMMKELENRAGRRDRDSASLRVPCRDL